MTPVRLKLAALMSGVRHSITEKLLSEILALKTKNLFENRKRKVFEILENLL